VFVEVCKYYDTVVINISIRCIVNGAAPPEYVQLDPCVYTKNTNSVSTLKKKKTK
jgi:hypothetical protein